MCRSPRVASFAIAAHRPSPPARRSAARPPGPQIHRRCSVSVAPTIAVIAIITEFAAVAAAAVAAATAAAASVVVFVVAPVAAVLAAVVAAVAASRLAPAVC